MSRTFEIYISGEEYDTGYGEVSADLSCDVEVTEADGKITATVKDGTWFLIDQDGGNSGEVPYEKEDYDEELKRRALEEYQKVKELA